MSAPDDLDVRLADLEARFVHAEQTLQDLSDMTRQQWDLIDALKREIERLKDRAAALEDRAQLPNTEDEKPPHY